jgi:hypothetical protein
MWHGLWRVGVGGWLAGVNESTRVLYPAIRRTTRTKFLISLVGMNGGGHPSKISGHFDKTSIILCLFCVFCVAGAPTSAPPPICFL